MIGFPRGFINHFQADISRVMARAGIEIASKYTATFGGSKPVINATVSFVHQSVTAHTIVDSAAPSA